MASGIDKCPYCGGNILKGAMKCPSCGKLLTTAEQQQQNIIKHKEASSKFDLKGFFFKVLVAIGVIAYVAKYFDSVKEFLKDFI